MGPNVKFVSAITDAFSKKKWGSIFSGKKTKPVGVRGRFGKKTNFSPFFNPSLGKDDLIRQNVKALALFQ